MILDTARNFRVRENCIYMWKRANDLELSMEPFVKSNRLFSFFWWQQQQNALCRLRVMSLFDLFCLLGNSSRNVFYFNLYCHQIQHYIGDSNGDSKNIFILSKTIEDTDNGNFCYKFKNARFYGERCTSDLHFFSELQKKKML